MTGAAISYTLHAKRQYAEVAQLVERLLAKEKVAGSNPVARLAEG